MAITQKHLYGWKMEQILLPFFQDILDSELTPTTYRYDGCDMISEEYIVELKARPKYSVKYNKLQDMNTYNNWLLPCCKIDKLKDNRKFVIFYYWGANQKCFRLDYDPVKFQSYERGIPWYSNQEHFFIPKEDWTLVLEDVAD